MLWDRPTGHASRKDGKAEVCPSCFNAGNCQSAYKTDLCRIEKYAGGALKVLNRIWGAVADFYTDSGCFHYKRVSALP